MRMEFTSRVYGINLASDGIVHSMKHQLTLAWWTGKRGGNMKGCAKAKCLRDVLLLRDCSCAQHNLRTKVRPGAKSHTVGAHLPHCSHSAVLVPSLESVVRRPSVADWAARTFPRSSDLMEWTELQQNRCQEINEVLSTMYMCIYNNLTCPDPRGGSSKAIHSMTCSQYRGAYHVLV